MILKLTLQPIVMYAITYVNYRPETFILYIFVFVKLEITSI